MTEQFSKSMANTLSNLGINLNFAPVLDVDHGAGTVISDSKRAFSSDPKTVMENSKIFIDQHKLAGVITCGKHFPGLGSASGDPMRDLPIFLTHGLSRIFYHLMK